MASLLQCYFTKLWLTTAFSSHFYVTYPSLQSNRKSMVTITFYSGSVIIWSHNLAWRHWLRQHTPQQNPWHSTSILYELKQGEEDFYTFVLQPVSTWRDSSNSWDILWALYCADAWWASIKFSFWNSSVWYLRWFSHNIRAIMAKIKLPINPLSMVINYFE